jgi:pyruvate/2-oxoglutarate dehydrogenase complex dihydrolipoamide acyltransferase (E2) component
MMVALTSSTVRTAPALIAEVDAAVRSVLATQGRDCEATLGGPACGVGRFAGTLFSLRHAEAVAAGTREVRVAPRTVVTPLARDLLKQRGIALRQVAEGEAARVVHAGEWAFANEGAAESGLVAALRRALLDESWIALEAPPGAAARWVAEAPHRGALVVTDEASVSVWRACQVAGVRAASADDPDGVARAVRRLGVNLLVV